MTVEFREFDCCTRIYVRRNNGREHLVDLIEGTCECEHYLYRIAPHHDRGREHPAKENRCVHIHLARDYFLERVLTQLKNQKT